MILKPKESTAGTSLISVGVVSLITFFTIMLLTSFAMLIIMGARSDLLLSEKTSASISGYYEANNIAEEKLAEIHTIYLNSDENTLEDMINDAGFTAVFEDDLPMQVQYSVEIDEDKYLQVQIELPQNPNDEIKRLKWQSVNY